MPIRTAIVDDHAIMRAGLAALLRGEDDIQVVAEAHDGRAAVELVDTSSPDVIVMDIGMPGLNGIEATRQIRDSHKQPLPSIVILSMHSDRRRVVAALEAGAHAFVVKGSSGAPDVVTAIRRAARNRRYLSPEVAEMVLDGFLAGDDPHDEGPAMQLAPREREVLQLLAEGHSSKEIAVALDLATTTVESHRRNIARKLDIHSIAGLTRFAIREGLTPLE